MTSLSSRSTATNTLSDWPLENGSRVRVMNGGNFEGWAIIVDHASTPDDYHVRFEEDTDRSIWRRTVMPEWQEEIGQ